MKSLTSYINQNYEIYYKSSCVINLEDADMFLLGESHQSEDGRKITAKFIDTFGTDNNSLVLLEGVKARQKVNIKDYPPTAYVDRDIQAYGWDWDSDTGGQLGFPKTTCQLLVEIAEAEVKKQRFKLDIANLEESVEELFKILSKHSQLMRQWKFSHSYKKFHLKKVETFPARTVSMVKTLSWAQKKIQDTTGKIFLVSGFQHLIKERCTVVDPEVLNPFLKYIKGQKVVIMMPKVD